MERMMCFGLLFTIKTTHRERGTIINNINIVAH